MEELRLLIASNIIRLRTDAGMTQAALGELLNYSDKTVSKWERAESLPDVAVLKKIADLFDVTVDYILTDHNAWEPGHGPIARKLEELPYSPLMIFFVSILGVWTLAFVAYVILWIVGINFWLAFVAAVPLTLVAMIVLEEVFHAGRITMYLVGGLALSLLVLVYLCLLPYNPWQLFLLTVPMEAVIFLAFNIRKSHAPLRKLLYKTKKPDGKE